MEKKSQKAIRIALFAAITVLIVAVLLLAGLIVRYYIITHARTPVQQRNPGEWFDISPEGIVSADGSPVTTQMRVGSENKVIVLFFGGGISVNEYTAARPYVGMTIDVEPGFYSPNASGQIPDWCGIGISDSTLLNPFRGWSVIVIPYTTADFHVGGADYAYTTADGNNAVLHHHGYENYRAIMDEAIRYVGQPDELLVAGYSAGGYGAAMLTEDLMESYFPDAGHVTLCVDSSLLLLDNWEEIFRDVWGAPEAIADKILSDNLIVDFMTDLYETYGDALTYLYIGSVRDGALTRYQTYFDIGVYSASNQNVAVYTDYLRTMVRQLRENVPTIGIYLFDRLPFSIRPNQFTLTQHTILETRNVFWRLTERTSAAAWLEQAIGGSVATLGLDLLR